MIRRNIYILLIFLFWSGLAAGKETPVQITNADSSDLSLFVHHDQPYYLSGENIFYKTYLYDKKDQKMDVYDRLLEVRLVHLQASFSDQILSVKGMGNGVIQLGDTLPSGEYQLIAYINGTEKSPETWFRKKIRILNREDDKLTFCESANQKIEFFIEGRQLIAGFESKVVIKANSTSSSESGEKLYVVNGEDTVFQEHLSKINYAAFTIIPNVEKNIKAFVTKNGGLEEISFPVVQQNGLYMRVENEPEPRLVTVKYQLKLAHADEKELNLQVYGKEKLLYQNRLKTESGIATITVPYQLLISGLNQFSISDGEGNFASRLIYIQDEVAKTNKIKLNNEVYEARELILVELQSMDFINGSISITKREEASAAASLDQFISLGLSEEDFFGQTDELDNYLVTRKWEKYGVSSHKYKSKDSENHYDSIRLRGVLTNRTTGEPLDKNSVTVTFPKLEEFYTTKTDEKGNIDLYVKPGLEEFYGIFHTFDAKVFDNITFTPIKEKASDPLIINDCKNEVFAGLPARWTNLIENKVMAEAYGIVIDSIIMEEYSPTDFIDDLLDKEIFLEDYVDLDDMRKLFNGIVPKVSLSNNPNKIFKMFPMESNFSFGYTPLFYVDGKPTYDENWILTMNPADVESVGVLASVRKLALFGNAGRSGVISIKTKTKNYEPPISENIIKIRGYSYYPATPPLNDNLEDPRIPVFKTLLYWNPDVKLKKGMNEIIIPAGDEKGEYLITFEGVSASGKPVSMRKTVTIK